MKIGLKGKLILSFAGAAIVSLATFGHEEIVDNRHEKELDEHMAKHWGKMGYDVIEFGPHTSRDTNTYLLRRNSDIFTVRSMRHQQGEGQGQRTYYDVTEHPKFLRHATPQDMARPDL